MAGILLLQRVEKRCIRFISRNVDISSILDLVSQCCEEHVRRSI
uniref:Uncharacterized protein MANES_12G064400 n=1 Tax=Rhizophora mucronata TaxID=61149 RepID=A0A2P2ND32_RHIMU